MALRKLFSFQKCPYFKRGGRSYNNIQSLVGVRSYSEHFKLYYLIFITSLGCKHYYPHHFIEEETWGPEGLNPLPKVTWLLSGVTWQLDSTPDCLVLGSKFLVTVLQLFLLLTSKMFHTEIFTTRSYCYYALKSYNGSILLLGQELKAMNDTCMLLQPHSHYAVYLLTLPRIPSQAFFIFMIYGIYHIS